MDIIEAAASGDVSQMKMILERDNEETSGTSIVNTRCDREKRTALHLASKYGHETAVRLLIESRANTECRDSRGNQPLKYAIENGHNSVVQALSEAGAILCKENRVDLECAMCRYAAEGNLERIRTLVKSGISINAIDYEIGRASCRERVCQYV